MQIKELLHTMVCAIVDDVSHIQIEETHEDSVVSFKVSVAKDDVGKLIGTEGRIASAIRGVMKAAGAKQKTKVMVNINKTPLE